MHGFFMAYCCREKGWGREFITGRSFLCCWILSRYWTVVVAASLVTPLLVQLDAGLYAYLDHAEKQHGHKGEGEREQPALPEEITEVQVIKKAADSIAEFASAKGSALLFWRKRCIGSRQLKLFHKEEHSFQVR